MRYTKPPLTFEQQAQRLMDRGMIVPDRNQLIERLTAVSYYRLSGYWHPFKQADDTFKPGTTFETVWQRYIFDRQLRLLVMDAVERIEVAILRTQMVEHFTLKYGPFGYIDKRNFNPKFAGDEYNRLLTSIRDATSHSREIFVTHFFSKYRSENDLPLWMAVEVMSFGSLFTFFHNLHQSDKQILAQRIGVVPKVLDSWLHTFNYIRNLCAHHGRLWNRELSIAPFIPDRHHQLQWHQPVRIDNKRVFVVLTISRYLLKQIAPQSGWYQRLIGLLNDYSAIPLIYMGFPPNWQDCPIWQG
jgi:abortive infection bacteriophage resistance protein